MNDKIVDELIRYEQGELVANEVLDLFQHLVDTGLAWKLQGRYGRMAWKLIEQGFINAPKQVLT